jgi:glucose-1-phosphate cytidylyltransferase
MVEVGGRPILWHIMKMYSVHGIHDFIICLGYKGYVIKEYFANYFLHMSDVTFDMTSNQMSVHQASAEPWRVTLVDTGEDVGTGGRLKRVSKYLDDEDFSLTYGDGLSDVNITDLVAFHRTQGTLATVTAVQPPGRFGSLDIEKNRITKFQEKLPGDSGWINGGFFILSPKVCEYLDGDATIWEREPLERLAQSGNLAGYPHRGFWHCMDTLRDRMLLEEIWQSGNAPWKTWK